MSLLSTGKDIDIEKFIASFSAFNSMIHPTSEALDLDAFGFAVARLPDSVFNLSKLIMVQSYEDIKTLGFDVTQWKKVISPGRRRLTFVNPSGNTIASLLSSESDIHDLLNCVISFYIERKKIGQLINKNYKKFSQDYDMSIFGLDEAGIKKLINILGPDYKQKLSLCAFNNPLLVRMYGRATPLYQINAAAWMNNLINHSLILGLTQSPVYFVSSNSHSLVNIISGFINSKQNYIFDFASKQSTKLYEQWFEVKRKNNLSQINDFLYYVSNSFLKAYPDFIQEKKLYEMSLGIVSIDSADAFQSNTQLIPVKSIITSKNPDTNLQISNPDILARSDAYILNIEYPLGYAAYYLLNQIFQTFLNLRSIYIMGKAAILSGKVGDIQIPSAVYDEISGNSYSFNNVFNSQFNFKTYISNIYTNQKEACVYDTYLESKFTIDQYQANQMNVIEMENGPFLKSITEKFLLHGAEASTNTSYELSSLPMEVGIINYASDNPLVQNLTQESTSLQGVEPVYLASLAALQRIVDQEISRLS